MLTITHAHTHTHTHTHVHTHTHTHTQASTHHYGTDFMCSPIFIHKAAKWKSSGAVSIANSVQDGIITPDNWHVVNDPRVHVSLFNSLSKEVQAFIRRSCVLLLTHKRVDFIFAKGELI